MEDNVQKRLKDATENCLKCHENWNKDKKDAGAREKIIEAVHELRKVAARLEIEIAVSERDQMASKPIPIPSHRASKPNQRRGGKDNHGQNHNKEENKGDENKEKAPARKLPPRKPKTGTGKPAE
jgi:hypothetical protein